jgi:hypothetical protein
VAKEGPFERETYAVVHLTKLRAGRVPGFEGTKLLNLKLNKKLKAAGQDPCDLAVDCPEDLIARQQDQF